MYAKAYAAGIEKFALTARIGIEEATEFMTMVDALYPGIRRFQESVMSTAYQRLEEDGVPWVRSPMTRQRHVVDQGKEYVLINRLIQGMAAEVFKLKLVELDAAGLGDWLALPVHDEIVINVPAEQEQDATRILREVMNDSSLLSVPITSSIARGQRWGAKEEVR
jgi:DNA polymerase-1